MKTMTKPILEKDIQRGILEWLNDEGFFFWRSNNTPVYSRNNGGKMAFRSLPKYTPRGLPDIMCVINGRFVAIEVKRPGSKLRSEQADYGAKCVCSGGIYAMVQSLDDVKKLFVDNKFI